VNDGEDIYTAAAQWHECVLDSGLSAVDRTRFEQWLKADARHASAFTAIERSWSRMGDMSTDPRIMALRREALAAPPRKWIPRPRWAVAASFLIVIGAVVLALGSMREHGSSGTAPIPGQKLDAGVYTTAVGERSTLTLSDGSSIVLDTRSRLDVSYRPEQRRVRLVSGQAWFKVAKDPSRPFIVDAGDRRITALGTAFDVRLGTQDQSVQITLIEGKVSVEALQSLLLRWVRSRPPPSVLLPGDSLVVADAKPVLTREIDLSKVGRWREGQIVFDDDTLETAVEEVNRYSPTHIVLADASLAPLRISGVFKAGHSESFIETVTGHYPIKVAERADGRVVLVPNTAAQ